MPGKTQPSAPTNTRQLRKRKFEQVVSQSSNGAASHPSSQPPQPLLSQNLPFTESQFALALSIQKSKPQDLSTQEYIGQLRKRIKTGHEEEHRYIDTAEFWKDQYSKLILEKNELALQRDALELKVQNLPSNDLEDVQQSPSVPACDVADMSYKPLTCFGLIRQMKTLETQLADAKIGALALSNSLQTTVSHMSHIMDQICVPLASPKFGEDVNLHNEDYIKEIIHTIGSTYRQCLRGFIHLCRDIPGRQQKSIIVHCFVMLFSRTLGHIHKICEACVRSQNKSERTGRPAKSKYDAINTGLSNLLVLMITADELHEDRQGHTDILEGYLFYLLQHTGATLSELVFQEQVAIPRIVRHMFTRDPKEQPDPATQEKGRYLVHILKQILDKNSKVHRMLTHMSNMAAFTRSKKTQIGKRGLWKEADKMLQNTLLKSTFGGDDFKHTLKEPSFPKQVSGALSNEKVLEPKNGSKEWFVESIWSLIGWEIVSETK